MQFYRFKGSEYVLAARTLGASDNRLIFRHILPNAVGTIVTSTILMVPSVIFSESSLSYLKIIDLETGYQTSVGTMLSQGQTVLMQYPNIILWPAIFISLLMIAFNIMGNGLRDALNPQLRGEGE
jgi:oligopeptide transport system permease protein